MVEKRVLQRQTKKRTTVCFDQLRSKINRESEVQKGQFNTEDCQESSAEKHQSFEYNGVEIHDLERMEGFQAKENTFVERKAKESPFEIRKKHAKLTAEDWDNFLFTDECPKYLFQYPNPKNNIIWGSQECDVLPAFQVKQSAKVMVWGGMTGRGPTKLHMLPTGQTLTSEYYINQILEKEVKPLTSRRQVTGGPIERKLFSSKKEMTFVQDGAPAHTSKATQTWCQKNLPNFIAKDGWPANFS